MGFHNQTVNQIIIKRKKRRKTRTVMSLTNHLPRASISTPPDTLNPHQNFEHGLCPSFQLPSTYLKKQIQQRAKPLAEERWLMFPYSPSAGSWRDGTEHMSTGPPTKLNHRRCDVWTFKTFKIYTELTKHRKYSTHGHMSERRLENGIL